MTAIPRSAMHDYTDNERRTLLTGVPASAVSTRFGHPIRGGWDIGAIRTAWELLEDELRELWESEQFDSHRKQHGRLFAERILDGEF